MSRAVNTVLHLTLPIQTSTLVTKGNKLKHTRHVVTSKRSQKHTQFRTCTLRTNSSSMSSDDRAPLLHVTQGVHDPTQTGEPDGFMPTRVEGGRHGKWRALLHERPYVLWVLALMLTAYLLNQLDRYTLAVVSKPIENELKFGDRKGKGRAYEALAGPIFTLIYTVSGIPIGWAADRFSRRNILVVSLLFWSVCTVAMGLSQNYLQLAFARAGQGNPSPLISLSLSLIYIYI